MRPKPTNRSMFDHGIKALRAAVDPSIDQYACPICFTYFSDPTVLTQEHAPQKSIGGKILCLTCKSCNSKAGHGIDIAVFREDVVRTFPAPIGKKKKLRRAVLQIDEVAVRVEISHGPSGWTFKILGSHNDPAIIAKAEVALKRVIEARGELSFTYEAPAYKKEQSDIGYLKSAYLVLFAKLGYTYVRHTSLDRVREQIQFPDQQIIADCRIFDPGSSLPTRGIFWVYAPVQCLAVKYRDSIIALPMPGSRNDVYADLAESKAAGQTRFKGDGKTAWPYRFELAWDFAQTR